MKRRYAILIACIAYSCVLQAQPFIELLKLSHSSSSNNAFPDTLDVTSRIQESNADLTLPIKLNEKAVFLTGVTYERIASRLFADAGNTTLSSLCLKIGTNLKFSDRYTATIVLLPKYAGDFSDGTSQNYQVGVMAFLKRKISERFNYRYGFYYNSERFGPFVVPIFGLYYQSENSKFETTLMLPIQADASYEIAKSVRLGLNYNGQVRSYHFNEAAKSTSPMYLQKISNELYAYLKWQLNKNISVSARVGQSLGRKYKVFEEGEKVSFGMPLLYFGDQRKQLNTNFKDGQLYQLIISFRVPVK
jgi:hypothetical protein